VPSPAASRGRLPAPSQLYTGYCCKCSDLYEQVLHVQEKWDENNITLLDKQAGDWTITDTQRIYQTAEKLLSQNHTKRPRIVEVCHKVYAVHGATWRTPHKLYQ